MILQDSGNILKRISVLNLFLRTTNVPFSAAEAGLCPSLTWRNWRKVRRRKTKGKSGERGRRQRMTEMTADRERTVRGSGGRGFRAGQTVSDCEDVEREI